MNPMKKNLADTKAGWWIFSVILPLGMIGMGLKAIFAQRIEVRGTEVDGKAAMCFGIGWLLIGLGAFGFPRYSKAIAGGVSRMKWFRMAGGILIGVTFLVIGAFLSV